MSVTYALHVQTQHLFEGMPYEDWLDALIGQMDPAVFLGSYEAALPEVNTLGELVIYFSSEPAAKACADHIFREYKSLSRMELIKNEQDWNQTWNESFESAKVLPYWVIQSHRQFSGYPAEESWPKIMGIEPKKGFGTGTHDTTKLCLLRLGELSSLRGKRVIDFGCGSGILSIAAGLMEADYLCAIDIEHDAREETLANAKLNRVSLKVFEKLNQVEDHSFDLVLANILAPVLIEHVKELTRRLKSTGTVILSGFLLEDAEHVRKIYHAHLGSDTSYSLFEQGGWGCIRFDRAQ